MFTKTEEQLFQSEYQGIPGIRCIDQGNPGPTVAIIGVTHGNEISGFDALAFLLEEMGIENKEVNGRIMLISHNLEAYKTFRINSEARDLDDTEYRYIDLDINRIYHEDTLSDPSLQDKYEIKRARQLTKVVPEWDYLLDIHSTSRPTAPMIIGFDNKDDFELADKLFFYRHIYNLGNHLLGYSLAQYAKVYGKRGARTVTLGIESGSHFLTSSKYCAKKTAVRFLQNIGSVYLMDTQDPTLFKTTKFIVKDNILPTTHDFIWASDWEGFQNVKKGTVIAKDGGKEIVANDDYYLIMPTKNPYPGGDGVYLAKSFKETG